MRFSDTRVHGSRNVELPKSLALSIYESRQ